MSWAELSQLVSYDVHEGSDAITLRLAGELDVASPQLVLLVEQAGRQCSRVVLDLSRVSFLDARGLSLLLDARRRLRDRGGELVLRRPHRAVRRLLQLCGGEGALPMEEPAAWLEPTEDVWAISSEAVEAAIRIARATTGHLQLADAAGALRLVVEPDLPRALLDYFEVVDDSECAPGTAWEVKNAVYVPDVTRSPIYLGTPSLDIARDAGIRSGASIPLWGLQGKAVGMLSIQSDRPREWTRDEKRRLRLLASATSRRLADQASITGSPARSA